MTENLTRRLIVLVAPSEHNKIEQFWRKRGFKSKGEFVRHAVEKVMNEQ